MNRRTFLQSSLAVGVAGTGFVPGFPYPEETSRPLADLRLNANENALGLPDSARRAIVEGLGEANRYPSSFEADLIEKLAQAHQVAPRNLVLGNGSSEVIQMVVQSLAGSGARLVVADPTFEIVAQYARVQSVEVKKVALRSDFSHDLEEMKKASGASTGATLIYLCNPNNPTASLTPCDQIEEWIRTSPDHIHFLIDEAYYHYVEDDSYRSAIPLALTHPRVVVTRTFSKIYALAGMRLGYALAHPDTAKQLELFASASNINHLALKAALQDKTFVKKSLNSNQQARKVLYHGFEELGIDHIPSHTNFVMYRVRNDLGQLITRMRENGVRVGRPFPPLLSYNRISLGLPEEMELFVEKLRLFRSRGWI